MLQYITTSPTIVSNYTNNNFDVNHCISLLRDALKTNKKQRGTEVGHILVSLTEIERVEVSHNYIGDNNESLYGVLDNSFSGDLLLLLCELSRSSSDNDVEWIEKARNKINANTTIINQILMSRTNYQLKSIKSAYKQRFGRELLESLLQSFNGNASYVLLLKFILSDDINTQRKEIKQKYITQKKIKEDTRNLFNLLENSKGTIFIYLCKNYKQI